MTQIEEWVASNCVAPDGAFLRDGDGSGELDCVELLMPRRGFLGDDTRGFERTIDRIRGELGAGGPLLYRYSGQQEEEGAFLACSFWLVRRLGPTSAAATRPTALMDELVGLANDVGLLPEEIDPARPARSWATSRCA